MRATWLRSLAWVLTSAVVVLTVIFVGLALNAARDTSLEGSDLFVLLLPLPAIAGLLILNAQPRNPIGWLLMVWATGSTVGFGIDLPLLTMTEPPASINLGLWLMMWFQGWSWLIFIFPIFHLLQVFPTGRALTPRWRWLMFVEIGMALTFITLSAFSKEIGPVEGDLWTVRNPIGFIDLEFWEGGFQVAWTAGLLILVLGGAASSIVRFRRAQGEERQQMKWLVFALTMFAIVYSSLAAASEWVSSGIFDLLFALTIAAIPVAVTVAVLRFHLYEIDVVISRTLVYGALAVFIAGVYVAIVVGVGRLFGQGLEHNAFLSIAATALVAVAFQPVRRWLERLANRLVYGRRATPYQVLSDFSRRLAATDDHLLSQVARSLADGTSAQSAAVWVRSGEYFERSSVWPADVMQPLPIPLDVEEIPGADRTAWAVHEDERLGALTLSFPRGQQPTPLDERLLTELAAGMGLALRNSVLTKSLQNRIEELRDSRRRIVAVQDDTRRRLERDLHDGAQQQLVALKVKLSLARRLASSGGAERTSEVLEPLNAEAESAIQAMRNIARGIFPPLLEAEGLEAALRALARTSPLPVSLEAAGIGRFPRQVEAIVYFCILEALQNAVRHARASSVHISLRGVGSELTFFVHDDGIGFDPSTVAAGSGLTNIADRIDALEGQFEVISTPGSGTTISASVPVPSLVTA